MKNAVNSDPKVVRGLGVTFQRSFILLDHEMRRNVAP